MTPSLKATDEKVCERCQLEKIQNRSDRNLNRKMTKYLWHRFRQGLFVLIGCGANKLSFSELLLIWGLFCVYLLWGLFPHEKILRNVHTHNYPPSTKPTNAKKDGKEVSPTLLRGRGDSFSIFRWEKIKGGDIFFLPQTIFVDVDLMLFFSPLLTIREKKKNKKTSMAL